MARDAAADLAVCEAALNPTFTNAPSPEFFEWRDKKEEVVGFAPYWIRFAEAYRELAEARNEMLRLTQTHRPVAEITACSDRIGEAQVQIAELEGK